MFPIGDSPIRNGRLAWMRALLLGLNVVVFLYQATLSQPELVQFITTWGAVPAAIVRGRELITLVTSMFLHGGWLHIISNMLYLWIFGDNIEHALGSLGLLVFYLAGGVLAVLTHVLTHADSTIPTVGASGAIAAILGAYIVMFPHARVRVLVFLGIFVTTTRVTAAVFLGIWIVMQVLSGVAALGADTAETAGVAYLAHIGGFVFGLVVGLLFGGRAADVEVVRRR